MTFCPTTDIPLVRTSLCVQGELTSFHLFNPLLAAVWIKLRLVDLQMLSVGLHLAHLGSNLHMIKLQMTISEDFPAANTCY